MIIKEIGKYKLLSDIVIRNCISIETIPKGTVLEIIQIDKEFHKVFGPGLSDWIHWDLPVEKVTEELVDVDPDKALEGTGKIDFDKAITVWKNGGYKVWRSLDAQYASDDPDWLTNIPLKEIIPEVLADVDSSEKS